MSVSDLVIVIRYIVVRNRMIGLVKRMSEGIENTKADDETVIVDDVRERGFQRDSLSLFFYTNCGLYIFSVEGVYVLCAIIVAYDSCMP